MSTYTDWQQRQLDAEEPKRELTVLTAREIDLIRHALRIAYGGTAQVRYSPSLHCSESDAEVKVNVEIEAIERKLDLGGLGAHD